jgi:WD40 repeat protein
LATANPPSLSHHQSTGHHQSATNPPSLGSRPQVSGHARAVSSVAEHPGGEATATAGEDGCVNVWSLDAAATGAREAAAEASRAVRDALLCGVAFVGPAGRSLAAIAHDSDALTLLEPE